MKEAALAQEFQIRTEAPADHPGVFRVHELAFKRPDEGHLVGKVRSSAGFIPALSLVAVSNGTVVGHILFSPVHIDSAKGNKPVLALAPLAVHPDFQGKGVGNALTRAGIEKAKALGWDAIIVLGQPTYYRRFGFEPASEYGVESPFPLNDPNAFMVMELQDGALEGHSGTVIYPNFFSELD